MQTLVRFNKRMGFVHLLQGIAILILALTVDVFKDYQPTVIGRFFGPVEGGGYGPIDTALFDLPVAILVGIFILLSALFHFIISIPYKNQYLKGIENGINELRWYEYSLSSSIMIVLLATLFGLTTIEALVGVFALNAVMNLLGLLMEKMNPPSRLKTDWRPHFYGWIAGLVPWILITVYMFNIADLSKLPWFAIPGLLFYFLVFNLFAFNQILQYARIGKWKDYVFGEKVYVWLSLGGKSTLAWLVLIGILLA
jgi:hypothetical protein